MCNLKPVCLKLCAGTLFGENALQKLFQEVFELSAYSICLNAKEPKNQKHHRAKRACNSSL